MNCMFARAPQLLPGLLHEKHSILLFFLGNLRLLVTRFASCEAVIRVAGIGGSSRSVGRILAPATRLLPSPASQHPNELRLDTDADEFPPDRKYK